uniref:Variant surface glycoprotein 1818 n=1 Tax=Trypanosoma brucei TaxID=5691 RepID=M4T146_9TRYP|nr:variant surface glycoprotein 1818 [Trypanosoma brucei]
MSVYKAWSILLLSTLRQSESWHNTAQKVENAYHAASDVRTLYGAIKGKIVQLSQAQRTTDKDLAKLTLAAAVQTAKAETILTPVLAAAIAKSHNNAQQITNQLAEAITAATKLAEIAGIQELVQDTALLKIPQKADATTLGSWPPLNGFPIRATADATSKNECIQAKHSTRTDNSNPPSSTNGPVITVYHYKPKADDTTPTAGPRLCGKGGSFTAATTCDDATAGGTTNMMILEGSLGTLQATKFERDKAGADEYTPSATVNDGIIPTQASITDKLKGVKAA